MKLKFGTGGLRAVMGDGDGCMNRSVIQKATLGVAAYAKKEINNPCIAIAYDTRKHSECFAKETARIFASEDPIPKKPFLGSSRTEYSNSSCFF